jgi:hypothetical protein
MIARQIDGEYVFVKCEKSFYLKETADSYVNNLKEQYTKNGVPTSVKIMTPNGEVECFVDISIFEVKPE